MTACFILDCKDKEKYRDGKVKGGKSWGNIFGIEEIEGIDIIEMGIGMKRKDRRCSRTSGLEVFIYSYFPRSNNKQSCKNISLQ